MNKERWPSGRRRVTRNHVYPLQGIGGSNPSLSASRDLRGYRMKNFKPLLLILISIFSLGLGENIRLIRNSNSERSIWNIETTKRLIPSVNFWQYETEPFQRFRFNPTRKDMARINKLRSGATDTVRVLCLRVEFVEDTTPLTTGNGKMDTFGFLSPDSGLFYDPPHFKRYFERLMEGLRNYYLAQSQGKLFIEFTVMPSGEKECYQLPREMQFYGDTVSYEGIEYGLVRLMHDAFKVADLDPVIHFHDYDEFIIFHAGSGLQSDYAADGRRDSPYDLLAGEIPPGAIEAYLGVPYILVDEGQTRIEQATVLPEMMRQDTLTERGEINLAGMVGLAGTLAHEFAHLLGAYDLYDVTGVTMGVGAWSLMGYGGWVGDYSAGAPPGIIPASLDAYHRVALGFITPKVISSPTESIRVYSGMIDTSLYTSRPDSIYPKIIKIPINQQEYFLIENRQTDIRKLDTIIVDVEDGVVIGVESNEYDFFLPGSGILMWHIDEKVIADYGPYNAINIDPAHKGVDLEEADGIQDFDVPYWLTYNYQYEVYGYKFDPFSKQGYNDRFNAYTTPNSDAYAGKSFISVELYGERDTLPSLKDTLITIKVNWDLYYQNFPKDLQRNSPLKSAYAVDLDCDGTLEVVTADSAGQIFAWRYNGDGFRFPNGAFVNTGSQIAADLAVGDVAPESGLEIVAGCIDGRIRIYTMTGLLKTTFRTSDRIIAPPVLADLNHDGYKDVIIGSTDGNIYAVSSTGELLPGFPVRLGTEIRAPAAITDTENPRIVVLTADHRVWLLNQNGTIAPGFPITLGHSPFYAYAQPVVADYNRDGENEIAVVAGGEHDYRLYIINKNGIIIYQSQELIEHPFTGTLAVADMNNDGYLDIICAARNKIFAFNYNATLVTNFPFRCESTFSVQELVGNWIVTYEKPFEFHSSPIIIELNNDNVPDIIIGSPAHGILGFNGKDGTLLDLFPLMTTASVSATPLYADINNDGKPEIAAGSDSGIFYIWSLLNSDFKEYWSCAYHDPCHTGLTHPPAYFPNADSSRLISQFYLYPNPANNAVCIRFRLNHNTSPAQFTVLDMNGEPVIKEIATPTNPFVDNELWLNIKNLAPGIYVVKLEVNTENRRQICFAKLAIVR